MANTDKESTVSPQLTGKEGHGPAEERPGFAGEVGSFGIKVVDERAAKGVADEGSNTPETSASPVIAEPKPSASATRPSLVQLGSNSQVSSAASSHPKRFSAVNINKKFLEKNSSASGSSPVSHGPIATKTGGTVSRPQAQPSPSHSRLVTTKLTSTSPASSTSGAGWSRPSSAAPPNATGSQSPSSNSPHLPVASSAASVSPGTSQLPHSGKLIQPQPRAALVQQGSSHKDSGGGSSKPVWGNIKPPTAALQRPIIQNDFPTAAEVAQVATSARMAKANDSREAAETAAANKQARMEEADTFRGVHLDPNAHHWDEMEEDDDNFLDGVIEFGDGRQYKIESTDLVSESPQLSDSVSSPPQPTTKSRSRLDDITPSKDPSTNIPVSKEERFADDFDRSWPRSRTSPALSTRDFPPPASQIPAPTGAPSTIPISPTIPQSLHSPQDSSRVLFNERSNRLEPYSNTQRPGAGQYPPRRGGHPEFSISPELRSAREAPMTSPSQNTIQLLQKPGNPDFVPQPRRFSGSSSGFGPGPSNTYHRDRDQPPRRDGPPSSPRMTRDGFNSAGLSGKDRDSNTERGRRSAMGPPPLPAHSLRGSSRDGGRQLPPHLSQASSNAHVPSGRLSSRDSRFQPPHAIAREPSIPKSARHPSQSPALSHTSAALISPASAISGLPQLSAPELDEVRKDVMQNAAARAKQRRQQEEEEREKEKERARRKALELEERIKAAETEKTKAKKALEAEERAKDEAVTAVIEEAIKSVERPTVIPETQADTRSTTKAAMRRPPSLKGFPVQPLSDPSRSPKSRRTSTSVPGVVAPLALQAESWRSKASPLPPLSANAARQVPPKPPVPSFLPPPPSALEQVESMADDPEENLEVVDFSDMGKFVGMPDPSDNTNSEKGEDAHCIPPARPVASDFFDDELHTEVPTSTKSTWRQKQIQDTGPDAPPDDAKSSVPKGGSRNEMSGIPSSSDGSTSSTKETSALAEHSQTVTLPPYIATQRTPRSQAFYKEAAMSALDDAMSRIKGALDGMQAGEPVKDDPSALSSGTESQTKPSIAATNSNNRKERWIPPALRPRNSDQESQEVFHMTGIDPPRSPKPAWNAFVIKLPTTSQPLEPVNKRQLYLSAKPAQARWDILSFDPPVEGMSRRDFSLNEVLFRKQPVYRGKPKYRVMLPRFRPSAMGPRVNLPVHTPTKINGGGAFGKPTGADGVTTWRKPAVSKSDTGDTSVPQNGLNTTSRSPPPDILQLDSSTTSAADTDPAPSTKTDSLAHARFRLQPKMPAGSAVAFYRDSRIDAVEAEPKPSVNFIVTSELEESRQVSRTTTPVKGQPNITVTPPQNILTSSSSDDQFGAKMYNGIKMSDDHNKTENKSSDDTSDRIAPTPPSHSAASWTRPSLNIPLKESPARGPDPEHLKAVWSQTSNKAGFHGINSLEGIADDLTALPFTIQDVKSEDGETPPPSVSAGPSSRMSMSLHEVTRAFQQVPSSSSNSSTSHRTPPITAPSAPRQPSYAYTLPPPPQNNMRPAYASYPSPMMSHSPSPGVMYPHPMVSSPVPTRMPANGHTPLYSQPVWVSMAGPTPQNHTNMMRPMASPYPPHVMPYPPPGTPTMYAPQPANMQTPPQQPNGSQVNRNRSMSMMSPVIPHAQMYGSPVLMHAPVMQVAQNHGYMPIQPGRGQARPDSAQMTMQQHTQQTNHQQPSHSSYNPVPSSSFVRPTW